MMILASTIVALPLLALALIARRFRSDLEELAWRSIVIVMLVTPLVSLLPKIDVGFSIPWVTADEVVGLYPPPWPSPSSMMPEQSMLVFGYLAITFLLLGRLSVALGVTRQLRGDAEPFGGALVSASLRVPVTAGLLHPSIFLPTDARSWSATKLSAVLSHERAHVERRDPLWRFLSRVAVAVSWFHPLSWIAAKAIARLAEEAADREGVAATGDPHQYADVLLEMASAMTGTHSRVLASSILDGRELGHRIDAILEPAPFRRSLVMTRVLFSALVAAAIFTTSMTKCDVPATAEKAEPQWTQAELHEARDALRTLVREKIRGSVRSILR